MEQINLFEFHSFVSILLIWDNIVLFLFFSVLSISTVFLHKQYILKKFSNSHELKNGKIKLIIELMLYIMVANVLLFLKNQEILPYSLLGQLFNTLINFMDKDIIFIAKILDTISKILYSVHFIGSFLAFMILISGIFLAYHKHDLQVIYPLTLIKDSIFKKQLILGIFLTVLFGFYPLTYIY